ncbi:hypothetical protein DSC45_27995 [Streptomyces sp. YIM 130001]|uniref:ABC transporter substrate-binding protein n=1 Tax=Streptomyces sp. YIM 130001 TaxID=2259644 RepID=UPI000E64CC19|nr:ABC transporter substrate-binding protein [Streptomyces sp. YIM 130001]RII11757.1 hypothetical protein DSC45_27995 [Streptomyces sp. YIM 130001]
MTARRRTKSTRAFTSVALGAAFAVCATSLGGCGVLPGGSGDSGGPVVVMTWAPEKTRATNVPGVPAMAQTYARWVNENGGINGRDLKVLTCNEHNDPAGAGDCARRAVKEDVVAVVGSYSQHARSFLSPLEAAGIPYIGGFGLTNEEFTSSNSYPVNGGQVALMAGNGRQLARSCTQVSLVRPDTVAGDDLPGILEAGLAAGDGAKVADIRAAEDGTEFTSKAEEALSRAGADPSLAAELGQAGAAERSRSGCVTAALGDRTDTFFDSFRRAKEDYQQVRISSVLGSVDQSLVDRSGGKSGPYEGAYVTGWYPAADDKRWEPMRKVIREHAFADNRIDPASAAVQTTWIAYSVLEQIVESLGDGEVTSRTVGRALNSGESATTGGLTPTLRWRFEDTIAASEFPRLVNARVTFQVVRDGRLVAARSKAVDVSSTLEDSRI